MQACTDDVNCSQIQWQAAQRTIAESTTNAMKMKNR